MDYLLSASHCINKANHPVGEQIRSPLIITKRGKKASDNFVSGWKGH